jgi:dihydrolipoamide dehydrogenase
MNFDLIVIGSGPGGYVAAIRASQLGLKVAVVERESLGGICLNWGCIPTKALIKSAQVFEYIQHAEDYGIKVGSAKADWESIVKRSRGVADGMSKGVNFLMKKNKITVINGHGALTTNKEVEVTDAGKRKLRDNKVRPGMPVQVFIVTGERTMMSYLLKPITDRVRTSLHEE